MRMETREGETRERAARDWVVGVDVDVDVSGWVCGDDGGDDGCECTVRVCIEV